MKQWLIVKALVIHLRYILFIHLYLYKDVINYYHYHSHLKIIVMSSFFL